MMQIICNYLNSWCKKWRMVINCSKNKTEAIILKPKASNHTINIPPKMKIGENKIEYVKKTKVLGLVLDENLAFDYHAAAILKACWYTWLRISWQGGREWGINTSSLLILFKTVVLTKLLYACPIWLSKNLQTFKKFLV